MQTVAVAMMRASIIDGLRKKPEFQDFGGRTLGSELDSGCI